MYHNKLPVNVELTVEDFAVLINKMSVSDKFTAYNVLYGMILSKSVNKPDPNAA